LTLQTKNIGFRGIVAADSKISKVDGENGRLIYRGYTIETLAQRASFSEVVFLLLMGRLPTIDELHSTHRTMADARKLPRPIIEMLKTRSTDADPMDVLQAAVACLADHDPDIHVERRSARIRSSLKLIARLPQVMAAWFHMRAGRKAPMTNSTAGQSASFLRTLWGREPSKEEARLVDTLLVLHAEHSFNASTFTVRQVTSTKAHLYAAVSAGIGSLSGPLHGGANARVMDMLMEIGYSDNVKEWVKKRIESKERIMGLGHAVYKVEDPRARILKEIAEKTLKDTPEEQWFRLALEVQRTARELLIEMKGLDLYPNVDFYSGGVLHALGLPPEFFPAFFAISRVTGWCAHAIEEEFADAQPKAVIYRPRCHYIGKWESPDGLPFIPIEERRPQESKG
jgi:citrate synthase